MSRDEMELRRKEFVIEYYFQIFLENNTSFLQDVLLRDVYQTLIRNPKFLEVFHVFVKEKMFLLAFDVDERTKIDEAFRSELN